MENEKFKSKIKKVADAFKARKQKMFKMSDFSIFPLRHRKFNLACNNLIIIIEALNAEANGGKEWIPDYTDNNYKYELWWNIKADKKRPSGFAVSHTLYVNWKTFTIVGSHFCFISRPVASYCAKQFKKEWENYILLKK